MALPVVLATVFVEGVKESTAGKDTMPDHTGRPDDNLTKKSTKTEAKALRPKGKKDLEAYGAGLAIEYAFCEYDLS
jgi:hypothetical protein